MENSVKSVKSQKIFIKTGSRLASEFKAVGSTFKFSRMSMPGILVNAREELLCSSHEIIYAASCANNKKQLIIKSLRILFRFNLLRKEQPKLERQARAVWADMFKW